MNSAITSVPPLEEWWGRAFLDEVLTDYLQSREVGVLSRLPLFKEVLEEWTITTRRLKTLNHDTGVLFNPLRQIRITETIHSRLLGDLLDPQGSHSQGALFLNIFLKLLDPLFSLADNAEHHWRVTVETGRVDILIWRDQPEESVILIENKSNNAGDQQNQIYRYWHQEMYLREPKSWSSHESNIHERRMARYHLVYLPTNHEKAPASHSTERPKHWTDEANPFPKVPLECQIVSLPELTRRWVEEAIPVIPETNTRLRNFLIQYHELWRV